MPKLSGVILTRDNERTIERTVRSLVGLVDELIIVDDGSTDRTLDLVRTIWPTAKIVLRSLDRFDAQRNFGLEQSKGDWVIMIDSDEELSPGLRTQIQTELNNPAHELYRSHLLNEAFGKTIRVRLERPLVFKSSLRFGSALHETINSSDSGFLSGDLLHHSWVDAEDWISDMNHYSTHQAKKWLIQKRDYSRFQLFLIALFMPLYHFLKLSIGQGRWRKGFFAGVLYPAACAAEWWFSVLKYYESRYLNHSDTPSHIKKDSNE